MNEAELVLSQILKIDRPSLYLNRNTRLDKAASGLVSSVLKRRISGEPLAYILGKADFFGLEFYVSPRVLVPRPETEILVETVLRYWLVNGGQRADKKILDLGTGSGCMAVSLAKELPLAKIDAVDISLEALFIAKKNALFHSVKINFIRGDLFDIRSSGYDLIISNPPYIPTSEISRLQPEVQQEPRLALDGGRDGLDFYHRIADQAPLHLNQEGLLIMEMGYDQCQAIEKILEGSGKLRVVEKVKDYNGIERVIVAKKN